MATRIPLTAIYQPVENGWTQARIRELPTVITAAPSLDEALALLPNTLREYLLSLVPPDQSVDTSRVSLQELLELIGST